MSQIVVYAVSILLCILQ